ncbi:hypothetical protein HPP92_021925 [Vanilla planifolia]|uniref:Uncharacterized protein n=1 Tax=Vanilla planifolia TaxID=51239 RepID=A0A835UEM8_VANPL|nr:hypothetical protein HPP92_022241 [Vanilla planifolia]KAG0458797.1 hypothetical protein HPP92_021925 [Vanilla planifolia]
MDSGTSLESIEFKRTRRPKQREKHFSHPRLPPAAYGRLLWRRPLQAAARTRPGFDRRARPAPESPGSSTPPTL